MLNVECLFMNEHEHDHHGHEAPETVDAGSQALAEALSSSFAIVKVVMVLMVLAFFGSGFFQVGPTEKAVILRFGRPVGEGRSVLLGSGLHWSFPYPIDEVVKIPTTESQNVTSTTGWYFTTATEQLSGQEMPGGQSLNPAIDGYAITADRNIVHTRATLNYHIEDPIAYIFNFASASNSIQNALNNALLFTAAHFNVDDILTRDVEGFREAVQSRVGDLTEREHLGIAIDNCQVVSVAPRQLKDVFDRVTIAQQNQSKQITEANAYRDTKLLAAAAQASAITTEAVAASTNYVKAIQADAYAFTNSLPAFKANPYLFAQQRVAETMAVVLTNVLRTEFVQQRVDGKSQELRLMLNDAPPQPKTAPAANP
jgi:modulator of FtsH protease HflK